MAKEKVIALRGTPIQNEDGAAGAIVKPGHLVSGVGTIIPHGVAGGAARRTFALERDELGKGIDTAYAVGDYVKVGSFAPGDRVNALIASGQNITAGGGLESAGDGTLRALASGVCVGYAMETSGAVTVETRLAIEVY